MTELSVAAGAGERSASLLARFIGVVVSPGATFAGVAARPRWLGMMALTAVVTAACTGVFLSTEIGQQALLDEQVNRMESFGFEISDAQYERMAGSLKWAASLASAQFLVVMPVMMLVVSGILYGVFTAAMGGDAHYKQVLAVVAHGGALSVLQQLFVTPLNYARQSMSSPTRLTVFLPMLDESSFVARLVGMVDLFVIWWVAVLAIGMAQLYRRHTSSILTGFLAVYLVIAVVVAGMMSAFGQP